MAKSTIYFNRAGTTKLDIGIIDFAHYAKVTIKIGNTVIHTSDKLPTSQDYYNWAISENEKEQIMNLIPTTSNRVSGTMKVDVFWSVSDAYADLYCREYDVSFVLEEIEATKPTITITGKSPTPYADYVQSKTNLRCLIDASAKNNATVKKVTVTVGGSSCALISNNNGSYEFESDLLFRSGTSSIVATVTDSRDFTRTIRDSIYIHPYVPPILTPLSSEGGLVCKRWRSDTNTQDDMYGTECRVAVNVFTSYVPDIMTSYSIYYRYRKTGTDAWSEEILIRTDSVVQTGSTEFKAVITDGTVPDENGVSVGKFNTKTGYDIEIKVVDAVAGTHTRYEQLFCQETSFNIKPNGMGAAVGKYATKDKVLDSAWPIHSDENISATKNLSVGGKIENLGTPLSVKFGGTGSNSIADAKTKLGINLPGIGVNASADDLNLMKGVQSSGVTTDNIKNLQGIKSNIQNQLNGKSDSTHSHEGYSPSSHSHNDDYASKTHNHDIKDITTTSTTKYENDVSETIISQTGEGITLNEKECFVTVWGKVCEIYITFKYNQALSGDFPNITVGTLAEAYKPKHFVGCHSGGTGYVMSGEITSDGVLRICAVGSDVAANYPMSLTATYLLL